MRIMCRAAVKKKPSVHLQRPITFFLQPSGKQYLGLKVSETKKVCVFVCTPVYPGRKQVVISTRALAEPGSCAPAKPL